MLLCIPLSTSWYPNILSFIPISSQCYRISFTPDKHLSQFRFGLLSDFSDFAGAVRMFAHAVLRWLHFTLAIESQTGWSTGKGGVTKRCEIAHMESKIHNSFLATQHGILSWGHVFPTILWKKIMCVDPFSCFFGRFSERERKIFRHFLPCPYRRSAAPWVYVTYY